MSEKEMEIGQDTSGGTDNGEQKTSAKKAVKKPKVVKATANEQQPSAEVKKEKKTQRQEEDETQAEKKDKQNKKEGEDTEEQ